VPIPFHLLPDRTGGAAENMATDFLLLQRYPQPEVVRFRHYDWRSAAFTFGFGQKIAWVREHLPVDTILDLCRRPTGGGIVDHRDDWTYALVIPRGHPLWDARATVSYRAVHEALAGALQHLGRPAKVKTQGDPPPEDGAPVGPSLPSNALATEGVCFQKAELYDVVNADSGDKIAGAAQKRNKHGLLLQGSIWKPAAGTVDWEAFAELFTRALADVVGSPAEAVPWPDFNEEEVSGLTEQYTLPEWIEHR
jgi:lipoate-protein ligase A